MDRPMHIEKRMREVLITAQEIIENKIDLLDGVRSIVHNCRFINYFDDREDEDFITLLGVDAQTEDEPSLEQRANYSFEELKKIDESLEEYLNGAKPRILKACHNIIPKMEKLIKYDKV